MVLVVRLWQQQERQNYCFRGGINTVKYFIPPKLNRGFNVGPFSAVDALLLLLLGFITLYFSLKLKTYDFVYIFTAILISRVKIENRTIGSKALVRIQYIKNKKEYELRTCFDEKNKND